MYKPALRPSRMCSGDFSWGWCSAVCEAWSLVSV